MTALFLHEMKSTRKTLIIWTAILAGMTLCFMLLYPTMKTQMESIEGAYENMGGFSEAFGMDKISFSSAMGFFGIENGAVLSLGGAMFAALLGIAALAKEEGGHTAEFLMTHPVSRTRAVASKLACLFCNIVILNVICYIVTLISFIAIGEEYDAAALALYHTALFALQLEIAAICFAASAFLRRMNAGIALGVAVILYFLSLYVNISDKVEFLKYFTPFQFADAPTILSEKSLDAALLSVGSVITVLCAALAFIKYTKKDIAA